MAIEAAEVVFLGSVSAFDDERGLGLITADDGREVAFHCTAIAGGSRHVDLGARVAFLVATAVGGCREAVAVTPLALSPTAHSLSS